ncbi:cupredoxin domain-containing protein [Candidatus Curtissbacteria bacterium]|nr:cupredoxin domain-containing protein [Candidatus Curtissbacteria bacterium]
MIKKVIISVVLPIISALVVFLFVSGMVNVKDFNFSALPLYLPQNKSIDIVITDKGFEPRNVLVSSGAEITFVNKDNVPHQPASNLHPTHQNYPEFDSQKPISPGESWKFKIKRNGTWFFHDHLNPALGGKIKVLSFYGDNDDLSWTKEEGKVLMREIEKNENSPKRLTLTRTLAHKVGPEIAIELLNESPITRFGETHLVSHVIGEVAYEMYEEKALPICQNDELNGCSHGVVMTAISDIGLDGVRSMMQYCQTLSIFKNQMCLHAAGHAFTAEADYDVFKAIDTCDQLGDYKEDDIKHCYIGVFMENTLGDHNGLTPDRHPFLSENDLFLPCYKFEDKYQSYCYLEQASWWFRVNKGDIKKTAKNCDLLPDKYQVDCANNIGRIVSTATKNDPKLIQLYCSYMKQKLANLCISAIVNSIFALGDEDTPFSLCQLTSNGEGKKYCYSDLYLLMTINNFSKEKIKQLCLKIEKEYQYVCEADEN